MNKQLTPLEALERLLITFKPYVDKNKYIKRDFDIIETALKDKELQDNVIKVLKEVVAFAKVLPHIKPNKDSGFDVMSAVSINIQRDIENRERELLRQWVLDTCFPKELKALEIIKEHIVYDEETNVMSANFQWWYRDKETQDLLKEVLL